MRRARRLREEAFDPDKTLKEVYDYLLKKHRDSMKRKLAMNIDRQWAKAMLKTLARYTTIRRPAGAVPRCIDRASILVTLEKYKRVEVKAVCLACLDLMDERGITEWKLLSPRQETTG